MYQSLHMHTYRCHHATGTEREYIENAVNAGFTDIGFSDHTPLPDFLTEVYGIKRVRMEKELLGEYVSTIKSLAKEYSDKIRIRTGLELEYIPGHHEEISSWLKSAGVEYFVLGQHFLYEGQYFTNDFTDSEEVLSDYVDCILEGAATGDFVGVAHPDVIKFSGTDETYEKQMRRLCEELKVLDIPVEVNFYGIFRERNYPDDRFWKIAGEVGNRVFFSSDAHKPELVFLPEVYEKAQEIVKKYSLNYTEKILP